MFWRERQLPGTDAQTGGGKVWRTLLAAGLVVGVSYFLAAVIASPSKRNIEAFAALVFMSILALAQPFPAYLFTLALVPFPAQTSVASTSMMLIVAMSVLVAARAKRELLESPFISRPQDLAILGWGIFVVLSFYYQNPAAYGTAIWKLLGFITAVILYYTTISLVNTEDRLMKAFRLSQFVAIGLAVLGMVQWLFPETYILPEFFSFSRKVAESGDVVRRGEVRVTATFEGQELFAEYMGMCVMLQYFMLRWSKSLLARTFWTLSLLLLVAALFATATRGALIILVVGFAYLIVMGGSVVPRVQSGRVIFLALGLFYLAFGFLEPLVSHMMDRVATIGVDDGSIQHRSVVLGEALKAIVTQPFIGHGIFTPTGTFRGAVTANIHNLYLTLAYTIGIPGLVFFVWFLAGLWRRGRSVYLDTGLPQHTREIGLALNIMLVMFLVDEIKIEYTRQPLYMHLTWVHFGFIMANWNLANKIRARG